MANLRKQKIREKIVLIGDGGVGKTTLRRIWIGEDIKTEYLMTIGADFASHAATYYHLPSKVLYYIKFQVWDLTGQPHFKAVRDMYYRGAVGALYVFDVIHQESYMNLVQWIQSYWNLNGRGKSPLLIVGSKCDLRDNPAFPNQVSGRYAEEFTSKLTKLLKNKYGFSVHYLETSAKEKINVAESFGLLSEEILNYFGQRGRGSKGIRGSSTGEGPFPFIYTFPYPKGPPVASAEAVPLSKSVPPEEDLEEIPTESTFPPKKISRKDLREDENSL